MRLLGPSARPGLPVITAAPTGGSVCFKFGIATAAVASLAAWSADLASPTEDVHKVVDNRLRRPSQLFLVGARMFVCVHACIRRVWRVSQKERLSLVGLASWMYDIARAVLVRLPNWLCVWEREREHEYTLCAKISVVPTCKEKRMFNGKSTTNALSSF